MLPDRFWAKVEKTEGCWPWRAALHPTGYGAFRLDGKTRATHRLAYEEMIGPIPEGLTLDHLCRNRACCNPAHLEPVTLAENLLRGMSPPAQNARKTHCPHGHEYGGANLAMKAGARRCLACHREEARQYRLRKAA